MKSNERLRAAMRVTVVGIAANVLLVALKFIAGILGRSSAIIADALHSLSDFASDIVVIAGIRLAERPADRTHKYGHGKFETLSTLGLGILLFFTALGIGWAGILKVGKFARGEGLPEPGWIALYAAVLSIVIKEFLYHYTRRVGEKINSRSVVANAVHHRSDALSSVAALLGIGGAIVLGEGWRVLDPLAAILVGVFIVRVSFSIVKSSLDELLEASLGEEVEGEIMDLVKGVGGIKSPHGLKTRKIGSRIAVDIHVEVDPRMDVEAAHDIATEVEKALREKYGEDTVISVHIEPAAG